MIIRDMIRYAVSCYRIICEGDRYYLLKLLIVKKHVKQIFVLLLTILVINVS